jgi:hypothetical protein
LVSGRITGLQISWLGDQELSIARVICLIVIVRLQGAISGMKAMPTPVGQSSTPKASASFWRAREDRQRFPGTETIAFTTQPKSFANVM